MARRARRKRRAQIRGLSWRDGVAYYQRKEAALVSAALPTGRIYRTLDTKEAERAIIRCGAVNTLFERGDYDVLTRFATGELGIVEIERAVREGEWTKLRRLHREGIRLETMADAYLERVEATLGKRTAEKYRQVVDAAVAHFGRDLRMHELSTTEAEKYLHAPRARTDGKAWAAHTQASHRNTLGALWRYAIEREAEEAGKVGAAVTLVANPWRKAKAPRLRRTRFSYLTPSEARALLAHPRVHRTPRAALLALSLYGGGLRLGELEHLRTDLDVVLTDAPATSWVIVQSRDGEHAWGPKSERGERRNRTVPHLHAILVYHREHFAGERYFLRPESGDVPPNDSTVRRWVIEAFTAAGIRYGRKGEALTLHSLRHTYVTWQLMARVPLPTVAKRAGDDPATILKTYAHIMPESDEEADAALQAIAEGAPLAALQATVPQEVGT